MKKNLFFWLSATHFCIWQKKRNRRFKKQRCVLCSVCVPDATVCSQVIQRSGCFSERAAVWHSVWIQPYVSEQKENKPARPETCGCQSARPDWLDERRRQARQIMTKYQLGGGKFLGRNRAVQYPVQGRWWEIFPSLQSKSWAEERTACDHGRD